MASLGKISRGRLSIGVGAGWLLEEFEALGVPTERRGRRLDTGVRILRASWTGSAGPVDQPESDDPVDRIRAGVAAIESRARRRGLAYRGRRRVGYNANEPVDELRNRLADLIAVGVTDVVLGVDVEREDLGEKLSATRGSRR